VTAERCGRCGHAAHPGRECRRLGKVTCRRVGDALVRGQFPCGCPAEPEAEASVPEELPACPKCQGAEVREVPAVEIGRGYQRERHGPVYEFAALGCKEVWQP
jgi:hypothetical protein